MEFMHLIKASSMVRSIIGNIGNEKKDEYEILKSIEKLERDLKNIKLW